jgi:AcrR family transcriptional regulator
MQNSHSQGSEHIRDNIVSIATHIFSKFGFKKTTIDDIAQKLGKGKSSIYYYFKSKEEIYKEVINREMNILTGDIRKMVIDTDDHPTDKLRNYVLIRMQYLQELVNFNEALKNDYLQNFAFVEKIREKYDRQEHTMIRQILQEGVDQDVFNLKDLDFAAMTFVTAMKGLELALFIKNEYSMDELKERLDEMLRIIFYGLVKR